MAGLSHTQADTQAAELIRRAETAVREKDAAALDAVCAEAATIAQGASTALPHYIHGRILTLKHDGDAALAALQRAAQIDPNDARIHYSIGLVHGQAQRDDEAIAAWEAATAVNPRHTDALYNLGQAYWNRGQFPVALAAWQQVARLEPDDLETQKKVVQTLNALGRYREAEQAMTALCEAWEQRGNAPAELIIDQFRVAGLRVHALQKLRPPTEDLTYVYTFRVIENSGRVVFTVQLESSAYGRETGVPYIFGMSAPGRHSTIGPSFTTRPSYAELKPIAVAAIEKHIPQ